MAESTIDKIKDITVERQIRKLAGIIDEQNQKIDASVDYSTDIKNLQDTTVNQGNQINNLKQQVAADKLSTESAITNLQSKDSAQDVTLATHDAQIQGITESLVSDVQILDGITTGEIKVRIDREAATSIDSNSYNLGLPVSAEIIQGTGPSMFKVQITMSSGVKIVSNDFVFTTEAIGNDVYISSFTFKAGNQDGYLSADIGLNNGVTIEANNFLVPTDPGVISNITDLQNRMTAVEAGTSVSGLDALKTQVNKNTTDIESINTEISGVMTDLGTKADLTNPSQTIKADTTDLRTVKLRDSTDAVGSYLQFNADANKPVRMEYHNGSEVIDSGFVATVDGSGNPKNFTIPSGGEVWEEVNLSSFPTDWVAGDRVKIEFSIIGSIQAKNYNSAITVSIGIGGSRVKNAIKEYSIPDTSISFYTPYDNIFTTTEGMGVCVAYVHEIWEYSNWNGSGIMFVIDGGGFNGNYMTPAEQIQITRSNITSYISKMWRLKK